MIGVPLGLLAANATEWAMHKYVLHEVGADRRSVWSFHWHEHHRESRRNEMRDPHYERSVFGAHSQGKEALALVAAAAAVAPIAPIAPFFVGTIWYSAWNYYRVHKRSHLDPDWAREHLPWHYEHHMGKNQNANWCVTHPFFDHVMGTATEYETAQKVPKVAQKDATILAHAESAPQNS